MHTAPAPHSLPALPAEEAKGPAFLPEAFLLRVSLGPILFLKITACQHSVPAPRKSGALWVGEKRWGQQFHLAAKTPTAVGMPPTQTQQLPTPRAWATCQPAAPSAGHTGEPAGLPGLSASTPASLPICLLHQLAEGQDPAP